MEYLLELGVDVNQSSGKTGYALHAACRDDSEDGLKVMEMLLDHGADPNARGGKYETALQSAAKHGHLQNVKFLLGAGADPTIEGGKYESPLKAAMAKKKHYHVANFLRRHMASRQGRGQGQMPGGIVNGQRTLYVTSSLHEMSISRRSSLFRVKSHQNLPMSIALDK